MDSFNRESHREDPAVDIREEDPAQSRITRKNSLKSNNTWGPASFLRKGKGEMPSEPQGYSKKTKQSGKQKNADVRTLDQKVMDILTKLDQLPRFEDPSLLSKRVSKGLRHQFRSNSIGEGEGRQIKKSLSSYDGHAYSPDDLATSEGTSTWSGTGGRRPSTPAWALPISELFPAPVKRMHSIDVVSSLAAEGARTQSGPSQQQEQAIQLTTALLGMLGPEGSSVVSVDDPDSPSQTKQHQQQVNASGSIEILLSGQGGKAQSLQAGAHQGDLVPQNSTISPAVADALAAAAESEMKRKSSILSSAVRQVVGAGAQDETVKVLETRIIAGIHAMGGGGTPPRDHAYRAYSDPDIRGGSVRGEQPHSTGKSMYKNWSVGREKRGHARLQDVQFTTGPKLPLPVAQVKRPAMVSPPRSRTDEAKAINSLETEQNKQNPSFGVTTAAFVDPHENEDYAGWNGASKSCTPSVPPVPLLPPTKAPSPPPSKTSCIVDITGAEQFSSGTGPSSRYSSAPTIKQRKDREMKFVPPLPLPAEFQAPSQPLPARLASPRRLQRMSTGLYNSSREMLLQPMHDVPNQYAKAAEKESKLPRIPWSRHFQVLPKRCSNWPALLMAFAILAIVLAAILLVVELTKRTGHRHSPAVSIESPATNSPGLLMPPPGLNSGLNDTTAIPVCKGICCSSSALPLAPGTPSMPSVWWTNSMTDKATVQLRARSNNLWWGPNPRMKHSTWDNLGAFLKSVTGEQHLQVERLSSTQLRLRAPTGHYLVARNDGSLRANQLVPEPSTVFKVTTVGKKAVQLQAFDARFLQVAPNGQLVLGYNPAHAETFEVQEIMQVAAFRGVNLANWLLIEGWMSPSLFANVPSFTDGLQFQLQSVATGMWVRAVEGGAGGLACLSKDPSKWETFHLRSGPNGTYQMRLPDFLYWSAPGGDSVMPLKADIKAPGDRGFESFRFHRDPSADETVMIQTFDGSFLAVMADGTLAPLRKAESVSLVQGSGDWKGPCAFHLKTVNSVRGHWQLAASLGPDATEVLDNHYRTFVTEDDFEFLSEHSVNAVRIPIAYWLTQGDLPDSPFLPGAVPHLDRAFVLGDKYGIGIFISMHGAPGSQNGLEHSASRDGFPEWAASPPRVAQMVDAVEWVAARYSTSKSFQGIGLLNEPLAEGVGVSVLRQYYEDAYAAVRRHSPCAFVALQARMGAPFLEIRQFLADKSTFSNTILEGHFYNLVDRVLDKQSPSFYSAYTRKNRTLLIRRMQQGGRLAMVGEWSLAMQASASPSEVDYREYGEAQLSTYAGAKAGWFYFNYKMLQSNWTDWSFREAANLGWLTKTSKGTWP